MKPIQQLLIAALLSAAAGAPFAHTETPHAEKAGPVIKEQKAWGIAGDAKRVSRTISVQMLDTMRFVPDRIEVRQGETVRFVVRNDGKILHEMVIGDRKFIDEHAAMMMKFPNMEHDDPWSAHVAAGKAGEIVWHFNRAGNFDFACLIPGHFQAGMVGKILVRATKGKQARGPSTAFPHHQLEADVHR